MTATTNIMLRPATPADVPELGRICYEAFEDISEAHGFPPDFPSVEVATMVETLVVQREDIYSVAAVDGDRVVGSNHIEMWDEVAGVGPITVDVTAQGGGIGRAMMEEGIARAEAQGFERIRLVQDAFNMRSLALYTSVGFDVVEPLVVLNLSPSGPADANFRPARESDIDAMDELCREIYRISRRNEITMALTSGFPVFVLDRGGALDGYLIGTMMGHGVAVDDGAILRLLAGCGASVPDALSFMRIRDGDLYRKALAAGHTNRKTMNLMARGPYEEPRATWLPSVIF